jgi:hypothetical protein
MHLWSSIFIWWISVLLEKNTIRITLEEFTMQSLLKLIKQLLFTSTAIAHFENHYVTLKMDYIQQSARINFHILAQRFSERDLFTSKS